MIGLILFIVALVLVMAVAPYILDEKGYVLISFNHTTIEGTIIGFCGTVILVLIFMYLLYKLGRYLWSIYSKSKHRFFAKGEERKQATIENALYSAINDDYEALEHVLANSRVPSEYKDIRLALLAKAALANQKVEKALSYLTEISPKQQLKVAKLWLASGESGMIEPQLKVLAEHKKASVLELKLYSEVLVQQQHWDKLDALLPRLVRKKVFVENQWDAIFTQYFSSIDSLDKTTKFRALPKKLQPLAETAYWQTMINAGLIAEIEPALIKLFKQQQYKQLATLLISIPSGEATKLYMCLQESLKKDDSNTALLLSLACLANAQGDYDLAARVFDKALNSDNKERYIQQATLSYKQSSQPEKALILYNK
ncbi:heme biosynthesis protein HemY [Pseudoalteromonas sp. MMG010]|uniref:heme biosynthesis HemY N-terminal domain-containing protein n=1 Tax=Pseudoalteromonas sp. MMG010 TaxID=2822685 RepID=UPI001B3A5B94|nr:heme biosynthesis HemY N-terminal domain-containing protein [Pseudoalteromonas sp. MMG010]MBQ4834106.1 heme biosynthesis protein HemY [Pseudoalteromonas sp. MMG010]